MTSMSPSLLCYHSKSFYFIFLFSRRRVYFLEGFAQVHSKFIFTVTFHFFLSHVPFTFFALLHLDCLSFRLKVS